MGGAGELTQAEQQLLMAAAIQGLGPSSDLSRVSTARIVNQVLRWRGLTQDQIDSGWRLEDCDPEHDAVYAALVRMTHEVHTKGPGRAPERPGPVLFEGGGNWGVAGDPARPACWPQYNSCRLTAEGERLARALLAQHPEYHKSVEPPTAPGPAT
jgi:hypothetical protein